MAVGFILGRSGSGKTSHCLTSIADRLLDPADNHSLIFLVPEQATYEAEKAILTSGRVNAFTRLSILSFSRLQYLLLGRSMARTELSELGRELALFRVLRQCSKDLQVFGTSSAYPGMAASISKTIVELHQCSHSPDDIDELSNKLSSLEPGSLVSCKFRDIALIYRRYIDFIRDKFINPDLQLTLACQAVKDSPFLNNAIIWVDGFSGFTAQEFAILTELIKVSKVCRIALCLDPDTTDLGVTDPASLDGVDLFSPVQQTFASINGFVKKNAVPLIEPVILKQSRRFISPELSHLERYLFVQNPHRIKNSGAITITAPATIRAESAWAAKEIRSLVRTKNLRWRDIAIVASDLNMYRHYIQGALEDCGIPYFLDVPRPLTRHPVAQLIISAFQVITAGFKTPDVMAYLKTDLTGAARRQIDLFENYVLAMGIDGPDYKLPKWTRSSISKANFDLEQIQLVREKALAPLLAFEASLAASNSLTARAFSELIFGFLKQLDIDTQLAKWPSDSTHNNELTKAEEHSQFIEQFKNIFTEMIEVFQDDTFTVAEFETLLCRALEQLSLRLIPPSLDQVVVGSIERSRHPDLKAVFLLGATQKSFPVALSSDSILTDNDRECALQAGHQLSDTIFSQLLNRQYLAYIAFTRPSTRLYISYPLNDEKDAATTHSPFISDLLDLFTDLHINTMSDLQFLEPASLTELTQTLCAGLGRDSQQPASDLPLLLAAKDLIAADPLLAHAAAATTAAMDYDNHAALDPDTTSELFADVNRISSSRTAAFASCPYGHFAKYGLSLKARELFKFESIDLGDFYHQVLDRLFKQTRSDFSRIEWPQLKNQLGLAVEHVMTAQARFGSFAARNKLNQAIFRYGIDLLEDLVPQLQMLSNAGLFRQSASELSFGMGEKSDLPAIEIQLPAKRLFLSGKIDRLDIASDNSNRAVVFDFKSSSKSPDFCDLYNGIDLQLIIYLLAINGRTITGIGPIKAAGAFFIPINPPAQSGDYDSIEQAQQFRRKSRGLFDGDCAHMLDKGVSGFSRFYNFRTNKDASPYASFDDSGALHPDEFKDILDFGLAKIKSMAAKIFSGSINISPSRLNEVSPCSRCDYKPLCRFDWHINDYNHLTPISKSEFLEKIRSVPQ